MKKAHTKFYYSVLLIFMIVINSDAQNFKSDTTNNKPLPEHELKINAFTLIAFGAVDVTYEKILNDESSIGLSLYFLGQNSTETDYYRTFSFTPYYRSYFSDKYNKGFFMELFAMYYTRNDEYYTGTDNSDEYTTTYGNYETKKYNGTALGVSVGGKWVTKKGFVVEVSGGIGRVVLGTEDDVPVVGRGGILIGKRF